MSDDTKYILKLAIIPIAIVIIAIIIVSILLSNKSSQQQEEEDTPVTVEYREDEDYQDQLDVLALSLAIPDGALERDFPKQHAYIGGLLQSANHNLSSNKINLERDVLERLLNKINFWEEDPAKFGTLEAYQAERQQTEAITEDSINSIPNNTFENGYKRFLQREMMENYPEIKNKLFYDNQIIYIIISTYNKYIVTFDIQDNSYIKDYKVVTGQ